MQSQYITQLKILHIQLFSSIVLYIGFAKQYLLKVFLFCSIVAVIIFRHGIACSFPSFQPAPCMESSFQSVS